MPDFVRIGPIKDNQSGVGSRGWRIVRSGKLVKRWYGGVHVIQGKVTRFVWSEGWPRAAPLVRCRNEEAARAKVKRFIAEKLRPATSKAEGSYQPLPGGRRITRS